LILGALAIFIYFRFPSPAHTLTLNIEGQSFRLEIAQTLSQKTRGLSHRSSLCPQCGMIFIYSQEGTYPFWMKDTLIPLDMIWLDRRGKVVTIHTAKVETNIPDSQLPLYQNPLPAKYIIELPAGTAQNLGLKPGKIIDLSPLKSLDL
jgi:uncharacterized membrane protein (UPF0127 family)